MYYRKEDNYNYNEFLKETEYYRSEFYIKKHLVDDEISLSSDENNRDRPQDDIM